MIDKNTSITAATFEVMLQETLDEYRQVISYRSDLLFTEFLPQGYMMMTLSCVPDQHFHQALFLKCNLGMSITLLDDFADNPGLRNKELLNKLYRVPFDDELIEFDHCTAEERKICDLALTLRSNMKQAIQGLPGFLNFYDIFKFDFEQVMIANQYSELMTDYPEIINPSEYIQYGAYNMGMVLAGMIDLMTCESLSAPSGVLRQAFIAGQRHGRLSNLVTTIQRERSEGDRTNEIIALSQYFGTTIESELQRAEEEMSEIVRQLESIVTTQIVMHRYVQGLQDLHKLHHSLIGNI